MLSRLLLSAMVYIGSGCSGQGVMDGAADPLALHQTDTRVPIRLTQEEQAIHHGVMLQHLETVQAIVAALADEDYALAKGLAEAHLGFAVHRQAMATQHSENFPPAYHDLAMKHHEAAEDLADAISSQDMKQILPQLNVLLKACVACHLEYKVVSHSHH